MSHSARADHGHQAELVQQAVTIAARIAVGDFVIDEEHLSGFNLPGFPSELRAAVIYRVEAGKIARATIMT